MTDNKLMAPGISDTFKRIVESYRSAAALADIAEKYNELLMEVHNKVDGETRHETALRLIKGAENANHGCAQVNLSQS